MKKLALPLLAGLAIAGCGGSGQQGFNSDFEIQLSSTNIADLNLFISTSGSSISPDSCSEGVQSFCTSLEVSGNDVFIRLTSTSDFSVHPVYVLVENENGVSRNFRIRVRRDGSNSPIYDSSNKTIPGDSTSRIAEIRRNSVSPS